MNRVAALVLCALVASGVPARAEQGDSGDHWKVTDRSMTEFLDDGYELVAVVPLPGSRGFSYFLKNHRKLARCREETSLDVSSIPRLPQAAVASQNFSVSDLPVPKVRESMECAALVRGL